MSKVENKPNLRQFVVVKYYYKGYILTDEHVFTSDSFKEAIETAYESLNDECYVQVEIYEADGKTSVCKWYPYQIRVLYQIRQYLK